MKINETPDYDQDDLLDYDLDYTGIRCFIFFIGSFFGAGIAALSLAIYYLIINF
jgi:hypothetical protein